jgi:hypothetical protein
MMKHISEILPAALKEFGITTNQGDEMSDYDYKQLHYNEELGNEPYSVKGYKQDGYPKSSVCHGMTKISFLDSYRTEKDAIAAHPELVGADGETGWGSTFMDKDLKDVSHIPDEPDYLY